MTTTPEPRPSCRGVVPAGPTCPTTAPAADTPVAPAGGPGVDPALAAALDLLPWVLVGLLVAVVAVLLAQRTRARRLAAAGAPGGRPVATPTPVPPAAAAPATPAPSPPATAPGPPPGSDRVGVPDGLVDELVTLADLASTPAVAAQVRRVLRQAGVEQIPLAEGDLLDLDRHEVVATATTTDPALHDRVRRVHRPGWQRGGQVLRPAGVETWNLPPPS